MRPTRADRYFGRTGTLPRAAHRGGAQMATTLIADRPAAQWFASWFDSAHYHRLYAHRDEAEAAAFIDALIDRLQPATAANALDLGCGAGRHAKQLASRGLQVTGLDLAASSIQTARRFEQTG